MGSASNFFNLPAPRDGFFQYLENFVQYPKLINYSHLLGLTQEESFKNIRKVLDNTLSTERAEVSPALFRNIFTKGLKNLVIKDDLDHHKFAFGMLIDRNIDKSELTSIDIAGPSSEAMYLVISSMTSLKKLAIEPYRIYGDSAIETILYNLNLEELEVRCSERPCIFSRSYSESTSWWRFKCLLEWHTQTLSKLILSCKCTANRSLIAKEIAAITAIIPNLTVIRVVTTSKVADTILDELGEVRKNHAVIEFHLVGDSTSTTRSTPKRCWNHVTGTDFKRVTHSDVTQLGSFQKLEEVKAEIMDGAEKALQEPSLEKVKLLHIAGSPAAEAGSGGVYYELKKNYLFEAVTRMPLLQDVRILHCRVRHREIHSILMHTGKRLKRFQTSLLDQEEAPTKRFLDVIESLTLFNPNLRDFDISDCVDEEIAEQLTWGTETYEQYLQLHKKLSMARELLVRAAPLLDPMNVFEIVDSFEPRADVVAFMRAANGINDDDDGQ